MTSIAPSVKKLEGLHVRLTGGVDGRSRLNWTGVTGDNGNAVVYDNKLGDSDDSDNGTTLGGGNIVIHK